MKRLLSSALLLLAFAANTQAPTPVPLKGEPHHHLVFENEYVRVFRVSIPGHDATLLHQHDVPYLYISRGPADVINAVLGKPEVHLTMTDGQVGYSPGHFAHIARTDAGLVFNNVTIELLKPQGEPRNICAQVAPAAAQGHCPKSFALPREPMYSEPLFVTPETAVGLVHLDPSTETVSTTPQLGTLIVMLSESKIQIEIKGAPVQKLTSGDVLWIMAGASETLRNLHKKGASYLPLSFKGRESRLKAQ
jgi:hypothetical protein